MHRILAVVLFCAGIFCLAQSNAQVPMTGAGLGAPGGGGSSFLLDTLSATSFAAYSTRKLRAAYGGSALKVTTSAGGNATQNIGFNGTNDLDTTALALFILTNSGSLNTWYDQVGANDVAQATVSRQPVITNSGVNDTQNGHVWAGGITANTTFLQSPSISLSQPYTVSGVFRFDDTLGNSVLSDSSTMSAISRASAARYSMFGGSVLPFTGPPNADTSVHSFVCIFNGASSQIIVDGALLITGNAGSLAAVLLVLWDAFDGNSNAHIAEVIVLNGAIGAPDQAKLLASWQTYWGTP